MTKHKVTEREMLDRLHKRFGFESMGAYRYAVAEHVPNRTWGAQSIADFIAVDCWRGSRPRGKQYDDEWGHPIHGIEVKVSRSDWLRELKHPDKAEIWKKHTNYWWLAVPSKDIVKPGELPEGWGLLFSYGDSLRQSVEAPRRKAEPMAWWMNVSVMRSIQKTARKHD